MLPDQTFLFVLGLGVLVALIVVARVLGIVRYQRRRRRQAERPVNYAFTVAELNDLLRRRMISPDEFEKAKGLVLRRAAAASATAARKAGLPPERMKVPRGFEVLRKPRDDEEPP